MSFLADLLHDAELEARKSAWKESNQKEPLWPGRASLVVPEDLRLTQERMLTGLPPRPLKVWRW